MKTYRYKVEQSDVDKKFRLFIRAANNEIIHFTLKGFDSKEELVDRVRVLRAVVDTEPATYYVTDGGEHRWYIAAPPGVACHEGFSSKANAEHNRELVLEALKSLDVDSLLV